MAKIEPIGSHIDVSINVAVKLFKLEPFRSMYGVVNLLPDKCSTDIIPCFIMKPQSTKTRAWRKLLLRPPPSQFNNIFAAVYGCTGANSTVIVNGKSILFT